MEVVGPDGAAKGDVVEEVVLRGRYLVTAIKKPTSASVLKDVKVGDILQFSMKMESTVKNGTRYTPYIEVKNITQGTSTTKHLAGMAMAVARSFELAEQGK